MSMVSSSAIAMTLSNSVFQTTQMVLTPSLDVALGTSLTLVPYPTSNSLSATYLSDTGYISPSASNLPYSIHSTSYMPPVTSAIIVPSKTFFNVPHTTYLTMYLSPHPSNTVIDYTSHSTSNLPYTIHSTRSMPPVTSANIMPSKTLSSETMSATQISQLQSATLNIIPKTNSISSLTVANVTSRPSSVPIPTAASATSYVVKKTLMSIFTTMSPTYLPTVQTLTAVTNTTHSQNSLASGSISVFVLNGNLKVCFVLICSACLSSHFLYSLF